MLSKSKKYKKHLKESDFVTMRTEPKNAWVYSPASTEELPKELADHVGFWILKVTVNEDEILKRELEKDNFNWSYLSNPIDESSDLVFRTSTVSGFINDVKNIF